MGFRDRFYTPTTAKAILSWRLIVGVGVGIVAGLIGLHPLLAAGFGIAAYSSLVLLAVPRSATRAVIDPFTLSEPWRQLMQGAQGAGRKFRETVGSMPAGPLRDQLDDIDVQLQHALAEAWRVAKAGDEIDDVVRRLDPTTLRSKLETAQQRATSDPSPEHEQAVASLQGQLDSADRLRTKSDETAATLRLTQTQLDELVARAGEVRIGAADTDSYAKDVDDLVLKLEALRQAVEENVFGVSSLLRSNLVVATGTALSRLSGLLRVFVFAYVIGQTALGDAYKLGNETPNIVYDLLLGGVLSATLVPLFTSFLRDGDGDRPTAEGERATNVVITTAATLMIALTVVAVVAAPLVFGLYSITVSSEVDADLFRSVGTTLTRIFLVQILFYGLVGVANAYLQSRRRFFAAAWSPILPNLVIIATLLSLPGAGSTDWELSDVLDNSRLRWTLGLGATAGIASMALVVVPAMFMAGLRFRPAWDWKHPAVRKLLVLSSWTVGFVAANQVAVVVVRNLATREGEGIASAYFDAFTWFVLPHGLLAVSIATTFQPELARAVIQKQRGEFVDRLSLGTRLIVLLTLPASAGLFVLREPIVGLMQRGQFDPVDSANTARALAGLAIGLAAFSVYLFTMRGFYAHQDTRTPFVLNVGENLLNIVLALLLVGRWGVLGLGLAYSLAYLVAAAWALQVMSYKVPSFSMRAVASGLWRPLLAVVLMAEAMWFVARQSDDHHGWSALGELVIGGIVGLVVYAAVLFALHVPELSGIRNRLFSRPQGPVNPNAANS